MSTILAHDVDGRPLRAGDRVVLLPGKQAAASTVHLIGEACVVEGESRYHPGFLSLSLKDADGDPVAAVPIVLRRIDDRPDLGSWDEIEKITGWNPTKQPVEAEGEGL